MLCREGYVKKDAHSRCWNLANSQGTETDMKRVGQARTTLIQYAGFSGRPASATGQFREHDWLLMKKYIQQVRGSAVQLLLILSRRIPEGLNVTTRRASRVSSSPV